MESQNIVFKGTKDGVIVMVNGASSYEVIREAIEDKLYKSKDFFKRGKLYIDFSGTNMDKEQQDDIKRLILTNYEVSIQDVENNKVKMFTGIYEGRTKFIRGTVRSGQNIEFPGNIVIIGDINAGGQVSAGGNIIVLGSLRGMVHAGASGNEKSVIAAFSLQPTQIRIAKIISRSPDGEAMKPRCPELARIKDGNIVIEPYAPNKFF